VDVPALPPGSNRTWNSWAEEHSYSVSLPQVGDRFLGFQLVDELGRGGFGRVFLADQQELADRPVALKVTVDGKAEAYNLARLQHTHIMPIHSVHRAGRLIAVCMPYLGRSTLADFSLSVRSLDKLPESGSHLVGTLAFRRKSTVPECAIATISDRASDTQKFPVAAPTPQPQVSNLSHLSGLSYEDAVLWIGERIAEGLAHAHDRGLIHRDLKPANVLVTDDGQPMILDFNLAVDQRKRISSRGGTVPYMSPEQLRAQVDEHLTIDHRTDLYSLGLILFELLTGRYPFPQPDPNRGNVIRTMVADREASPPSLRALNAAITPTVEAIVHKCMAPKPADRYQTARDLIEDLALHRTHFPVRHAANPSWRERTAKWIRRNPKLVSPVVIAAAVAGVLLASSSGVAWAMFAAKRAELVRNAERGREIISTFDVLRGTAEQYLISHNGSPDLIARGQDAGFRALETLSAGKPETWRERPEFAHLPAEERERLEKRASELAYLIGRTAGAGTTPEWKKQWEAAAKDGVRNPIFHAAELHAGGKFREAIVDLENYCRAHPDDASGWFLLGRSHAECGNNEDAYLAYSTGIALRPRYAPGYYFRAEIANRLKKSDPHSGRPQALLDANRAVEFDPAFWEARLLRAQLHVQVKQYSAAREDLDRILERDEPPTRAWLLRAAVWSNLGEKNRAAADRAEGLKHQPTTAPDYIARGVARRSTDPKAALADFRSAEALDPLSTAALEHQAYVQAELLHRPDQAADTLSRLLRLTPYSPLAFISRAVYLARSGKIAEAVAEAEKAAELSPQPSVQYRVGCVFALAAKTDPKYTPSALRYLASSLKTGFGYEYLPTDSDLDPLRGRAEFDRLNDLVITLSKLAPPK
jgi:serine/threonine protein kinase/tetratricopeptide (TPR) repeat protein